METCRCGRELALLNPASDTPKCPGCGRLSELCPCTASETVGVEVPN